MNIDPLAASLSDEMRRWRRDLHAHPEIGFEEVRTARLVADKLRGWGLSVREGLAGTGVVGTLSGRAGSPRAIGLRADMDALPLQELNSFDYGSKNAGRMHACGHDGHTAMLLGAAQCLARSRNFAGTVQFIFQPAEEGRGGAERMVNEGLFEQFPCDAVYGLHNWPAMNAGTLGVRVGPMLASMDQIEIQVVGRGGHGALPQHAIDPVVTAAHIVTALQTLVSRSTSPTEAAVVSITCIEGGTAHNIIPQSVQMRGTVRSFSPSVRHELEQGINRIAHSTAQAFGATAAVQYTRLAPAVINTAHETAQAIAAAGAVLGEERVVQDIEPTMGSEDFSYMLDGRPGAYVFLGQGSPEHSCNIHSPHYDFNDQLLPIGASYWIRLVEQVLAA
ncbi:MAG TPA: M20 aminoacylase family protein [Steroidobacteraceae bacterium]|jgi:hippurate hydrolase